MWDPVGLPLDPLEYTMTEAEAALNYSVLFSDIFQLSPTLNQGCIFRLTCSHPELTKDHVLTSAYVKIFRTVTRNAVNETV